MYVTSDPWEAAVGTAIRVLIVLEAVAFLVASSLHLGAQIPLGFAVLAEPPILPATVVEGLCGLFLVVAAYAVFFRRGWAWTAAVAAHAFAIAGVLLGIFALSIGAGPTTELNYVYHRVLLAALVVTLTLLLVPSGRATLGSGTRP